MKHSLLWILCAATRAKIDSLQQIYTIFSCLSKIVCRMSCFFIVCLIHSPRLISKPPFLKFAIISLIGVPLACSVFFISLYSWDTHRPRLETSSSAVLRPLTQYLISLRSVWFSSSRGKWFQKGQRKNLIQRKNMIQGLQ